jgi:hypothetical protein
LRLNERRLGGKHDDYEKYTEDDTDLIAVGLAAITTKA